ncbi:DUF6019 family protein [Nocardioides sp. CN2-186]|uniref:DUF6019 family protein n=1 Tax=Nocardioides tweenelious TaxID=3156607 RepID=UPI0032B61D0B
MLDISVLGILAFVVATFVALTVVYYVIRYAVRDGMLDAHRKLDADRVRSDLRLGPERSPNSRG